jgi:hypothetical protein
VSPASASALQPHIESRILLLREQRAMLDADLARSTGSKPEYWCKPSSAIWHAFRPISCSS